MPIGTFRAFRSGAEDGAGFHATHHTGDGRRPVRRRVGGKVDPGSEPFPAVVVAVDDELAAGIIESSLCDAGHRVIRARHGAEVLQLVAADDAHIVVVDFNTARRSGLEVIRLLQRHRRRAQLRILALTVQGRGLAEHDARDAGADDFLMRPFNPGDLVVKIDRLFSRVAAA